MAVSVFKKKLTRRGGLRTSGVLQSTSMEIARFSVQNGVSSQIRRVLDQYFGIFQGFFFCTGPRNTILNGGAVYRFLERVIHWNKAAKINEETADLSQTNAVFCITGSG